MNFWDERYGAAAESYVFGTEPNDFLAAHAHLIPPGPVLCLAEGEGRNAVFLAQRPHHHQPPSVDCHHLLPPQTSES